MKPTMFQIRFESEMIKQGRSIEKLPSGAYKDYASAIMWSWAQWGQQQKENEQ